MRIKRDYGQPFFRQPKRRRGRKLLLTILLGALLGLVVATQQASLERIVSQLGQPAATPTPMPAERAWRASNLAEAGDFAAAADLLAQITAERPNSVAHLNDYGRALLELADYESALSTAQRMLDLDPRDARGFALKAAALVGADQASAAIPIALTGLELDRELAATYATLVRAYIATQRWADALDTGERGLSLNPDDAELTRAYAYALQAVGAFDDASAYLERSIELRPGYLPAQFELAALYLARDQDQRAIEHYERILSLDSRNARAMLRLCLAYRKIGQFSRALGFCEDAVANDADDAEALFQLAMLYYRERRFDESRDMFLRCVSRAASVYDLSCRYRLGLSHYYTGDCAAGWALLTESLATAEASSSAALDNIRLGLSEIRGDPACIDQAAAPASLQD